MAKRKRTEPTDVVQQSKESELKKLKIKDDSATKQKTSATATLKQKAAAQEIEQPALPTAVRIIVGSYEKVLAGIDATFNSSSGDNVISSISFLIVA